MRGTGEPLVVVEGASKKFCKDLRTSLRYGMSDLTGEVLGRPRSAALRPKEFWAVQEASFTLRRGECLGLIGRNGAGKTTLLRMLNGLIKPDRGSIEMRGRVGALIALGAGFNPVLTGRENIYVNGAILGLSKAEITARLDEIIAFSELGEFIDSPVQTYSSGMSVRLGFAVATAMDPDILILDEVLAVGDASFRHKCYHRINAIMRNCAVIFVSHSMSQIAAVATAVGMMRRGRFSHYPSVIDGIAAYNEENADDAAESSAERVFEVYPPVRSASVSLVGTDFNYGGAIEVAITVDLEEPMPRAVLSFTAVNANEQPVLNWNSGRTHRPMDLPAGRSVIRFRIDPLLLHDGRYRWNLWLSRPSSIEASIYAMRGGWFRVNSPFRPINDIPYLPDPNDFTVDPVH